MPNTFGGLAFPKRSSAVTAMEVAPGMVMPFEDAGRMAWVRQVPLVRAWMTTLAVLGSGIQRMEVALFWICAETPGALGGRLLSQGMGGMAAGWV